MTESIATNGADSLMKTLADAGVTLCLTNPGTTEVHLVAALEKETRIRTILGLFEGVCSGAADGFARMTGRPAATLLHLGPGLANAMANLHNARRANSPVINLVGDHPQYHRDNDPPLASDIAAMAQPVSGWVGQSKSAADLPSEGLAAFQAAMAPPGQPVTLVIPADCAWGAARATVNDLTLPAPVTPDAIPDTSIDRCAQFLGSGRPTALILGGKALLEPGLCAAARIAQKSGAVIMSQTFDARFTRGAGLPAVKRLPYFPERARKRLSGFPQIILAGTRLPTAFFGYPDRSVDLLAEGCQVETLASPQQDAVAGLEALADALGAKDAPEGTPMHRPDLPTGDLTIESVGAAIGALLPENAIVSDESGTSGGFAYIQTAGAQVHDWLCLTGGSIGQGVPVATGAALACPDRKVVCLQGDGGAMYTIQALWTQAREGLDVTTVIFSNRKYQILQVELHRLGFQNPGQGILSTMDLTRPDLDWLKLSEAMGVPAQSVNTVDEFNLAFSRSVSTAGPSLIEVKF